MRGTESSFDGAAQVAAIDAVGLLHGDEGLGVELLAQSDDRRHLPAPHDAVDEAHGAVLALADDLRGPEAFLTSCLAAWRGSGPRSSASRSRRNEHVQAYAKVRLERFSG